MITVFTNPNPVSARQAAVDAFLEGTSSKALKEFAADSLEFGKEFVVSVDEEDVTVHRLDARREEWEGAPLVASYPTSYFWEFWEDGELAVGLYLLIALGECGYRARLGVEA